MPLITEGRGYPQGSRGIPWDQQGSIKSWPRAACAGRCSQGPRQGAARLSCCAQWLHPSSITATSWLACCSVPCGTEQHPRYPSADTSAAPQANIMPTSSAHIMPTAVPIHPPQWAKPSPPRTAVAATMTYFPLTCSAGHANRWKAQQSGWLARHWLSPHLEHCV
jgi:hypothetical protein